MSTGWDEIEERQREQEEREAKPKRPQWQTALFWLLRIAFAVILLKIAYNVIQFQVIHFS